MDIGLAASKARQALLTINISNRNVTSDLQVRGGRCRLGCSYQSLNGALRHQPLGFPKTTKAPKGAFVYVQKSSVLVHESEKAHRES